MYKYVVALFESPAAVEELDAFDDVEAAMAARNELRAACDNDAELYEVLVVDA